MNEHAVLTLATTAVIAICYMPDADGAAVFDKLHAG